MLGLDMSCDNINNPDSEIRKQTIVHKLAVFFQALTSCCDAFIELIICGLFNEIEINISIS